MSILPKTPLRFEKSSFWDSAYSGLEKPFEWYAEFEDLLPVFLKYFRTSDKILNLGCGNSDLGSLLVNSGWNNISNIDISETVISKMKQQYPDGDYQQMDATKMTFDDGLFDCAVDKGTLDALLPTSNNENVTVVRKMLSETMRVLKPSGRLLIVSLAQKHVVHLLSNFFEGCSNSSVIRAHYLPMKTEEQSFFLPVFVFIIMKMNLKLPKPIFELQSRSGLNLDLNTRLNDRETWEKALSYCQILQYNLRSINSRFPPRNFSTDQFDLSIELDKSDYPIGGFKLFVVDKPRPHARKFAVFVVPCGREIDELYSTAEGRNRLAEAVAAGRLIVCLLIPNASSAGQREKPMTLNEVTSMLNDAVMEVAPPAFELSVEKAPYLSESIVSQCETNIVGSEKINWFTETVKLVEIESPRSSCKFHGKKRKVNTSPIRFNRLVEVNHISCIAEACCSHSTSVNWNCQKVSRNGEVANLLSNISSAYAILQIGDDCGTLLNKLANYHATSATLIAKTWRVFCNNAEQLSGNIPEHYLKLFKSSPYDIRVEDNLANLKGQFNLVFVLLSCAFLSSLRVFSESVKSLAAEDSTIVLLRCCRESDQNLTQVENEIKRNCDGNRLLSFDITETLGNYSE